MRRQIVDRRSRRRSRTTCDGPGLIREPVDKPACWPVRAGRYCCSDDLKLPGPWLSTACRTSSASHTFNRSRTTSAARVEVKRCDHRLEYVADQRSRKAAIAGHAATDNQAAIEPQRAGDSTTGTPTDHCRLDLRQVPLVVLGVILVEPLANGQSENGVAEKLQPFVASQTVGGPRSMCQRREQQRLILELIVDDLLAFGQLGSLIASVDLTCAIHEVNVGGGIGEMRIR